MTPQLNLSYDDIKAKGSALWPIVPVLLVVYDLVTTSVGLIYDDYIQTRFEGVVVLMPLCMAIFVPSCLYLIVVGLFNLCNSETVLHKYTKYVSIAGYSSDVILSCLIVASVIAESWPDDDCYAEYPCLNCTWETIGHSADFGRIVVALLNGSSVLFDLSLLLAQIATISVLASKTILHLVQMNFMVVILLLLTVQRDSCTNFGGDDVLLHGEVRFVVAVYLDFVISFILISSLLDRIKKHSYKSVVAMFLGCLKIMLILLEFYGLVVISWTIFVSARVIINCIWVLFIMNLIIAVVIGSLMVRSEYGHFMNDKGETKNIDEQY